MYSTRDNNIKAYQASQVKEASYGHTFTPPCQAACPLHMNISEYVDLVAQGKVMEALQIIRDGNPFPSICAYVCTHPCEDACRRGQVEKPIAIRALKRFAVEFGGDRMLQLEADTTQTEKVAIVGSGPAGLACAYYLRKLGYSVTIFEAHSELGGMLRAGIPQYRLPREVVDTEGRFLGKVDDILLECKINCSDWNVPSLLLKIDRDMMNILNLKKGFLSEPLISMSMEQVQYVGDVVMLKNNAKELDEMIGGSKVKKM